MPKEISYRHSQPMRDRDFNYQTVSNPDSTTTDYPTNRETTSEVFTASHGFWAWEGGGWLPGPGWQ